LAAHKPKKEHQFISYKKTFSIFAKKMGCFCEKKYFGPKFPQTQKIVFDPKWFILIE